MIVYADHAATTPLLPSARAALLESLDFFGNPSSLHQIGQAANRQLCAAREKIAALLGCAPREIIFTSGGTEADNMALRSLFYAGGKERPRLVTTSIEHHAVLHTIQALEAMGAKAQLLPVLPSGHLDPAVLAGTVDEKTAGVSVMAVNNELGTVQPIKEAAEICHARQIPLHCDAVQGISLLKNGIKSLGADLVSLSAHKFGGLKGTGLLYVRQGCPLTPLLYGGAQERGFRAGTEHLPGIVAMAVALEETLHHIEEKENRRRSLLCRLSDQIRQIKGIRLNSDPAASAGILSVTFTGFEASLLLLRLDQAGICASAGSACAAGALTPSHVLRAIGLDTQAAKSTLRFSLSYSQTEEEIDYLAQTIRQLVSV